MRDHATATVDHHRLAVHADAAVGGEPLHLREVHGAGEKPDQVPPRVEDGDGNDDCGYARITFGPDHIGILGPDAPGVEHVLDVVPIAVVDAHPGGRCCSDRPAVQVPDVELDQSLLGGVGGGERLVQACRVEGRVIQVRDAG